MSLVVGTNSYADAASADIYFSDRIYADEWTALSSEDKDKVLITATTILDTLCYWDGDKTDTTQYLEFPRDGETTVPSDIIVSLYEMSLEMVKQSLASFVMSSELLKQLKAGALQLSFYEFVNTPITIVNNIAKSKLSKYGSCNFGGSDIQVVGLER